MIQPVMIGGGISRCENNSFCPCGPVLMSLQEDGQMADPSGGSGGGGATDRICIDNEWAFDGRRLESAS